MNSIGFKKIEKKTLPMSVVEQIQSLIVDKKLGSNQKLPSEREMAEILGVSRPSIREAIKILEATGLVSVKSGSGTYLNKFQNERIEINSLSKKIEKYTFLELVEARKILEAEIAYLAASKSSSDDINRIEQLLNKMKSSKNSPDAFLSYDYSYHMAIADASRNRVLKEMLRTTRALLLETNTNIIRKPGQVERVIRNHEDILESIKEGNASLARKSMLNHLNTIEVAINEIYGE